jgi:hypothetical protein
MTLPQQIIPHFSGAKKRMPGIFLINHPHETKILRAFRRRSLLAVIAGAR